MERKLRRHDAAVRARLDLVGSALDLPAANGDGVQRLLALLATETVEPDVRAAAAILAATGSYATEEQLRELTPWLAAGAQQQARDAVARWVRAARRRALDRRLEPAPPTVIDLTRTSRAVETTGIPRVARALAAAGAARGVGLIVWENGVPGLVTLDEGGAVSFPRSSWRGGGAFKGILTRVKVGYWTSMSRISRLPGGSAVVVVLRTLVAPIARTFFDGSGPTSAVLLTDCRYISPEVNLPDSVTRLLAWVRVDPTLQTTVVVHDFLPLITPHFFADDQLLEHIAFARLVAASGTIVIASPHIAPQVAGVRLLHGGGCPQAKTLTVPYGISTGTWTEQVIPKRAGAEFLMVGSMEPRKNHALALQALGRLAVEGQPVTLHVVGSARPVQAVTREALDFARRRGVTVVEYLKASDGLIRGLMANCVASFYLSSAEGFGLPVLESLSFRLPVIASDTAPNREHVAYGGVLLVAPDRPDELCALLTRLLADPRWQEQLRRDIDVAALPLGYEGWASAILDQGRDRASASPG